MMTKYEQHSVLSDSDFRRLTGVHKTTFEHMLAVLSQQISKTKKVAGRPSRLSVADQLLMMLEYNREYRTYFHIAQSYHVSEATAFRLISRAENYLLKSGQFSLPGKKALLQSQLNYEILIVDASETKIERPQKNRQQEVNRFVKNLTEEETQKVDLITKNIIQKILKLPVLQLKAACQRGEADQLSEVLRSLFHLEAKKEGAEA